MKQINNHIKFFQILSNTKIKKNNEINDAKPPILAIGSP